MFPQLLNAGGAWEKWDNGDPYVMLD